MSCMTKDDALLLIERYGEHLKKHGEEDPVLTEIRSRFPEDGSEKKAMRWLGFMQGALYMLKRFGHGRGFTLDALKDHSRDPSNAVIS